MNMFQFVKNRKRIEKIITPAIYCIDKEGKYGLAINFKRHDVIRPGYHTDMKHKMQSISLLRQKTG